MKRALLILTMMSIVIAMANAQEQAVLVRKTDKTRFAIKNADVDSVVMRNADEVDKKWYGADTVDIVSHVDYNPLIPSTAKMHPYTGDYITLDSMAFSYRPCAYNLPMADAMACSGHYMAMVNIEQKKFYLYDIDHRKLAGEKSLGADYVQCAFASYKIATTDKVPVLFLMTASQSGVRTIRGFRLLITEDDATGEVTDFTMSQTQLLKLPTANSTNALSQLSMSVDADNDYAYFVSCCDDITASNYLRWRISKIALPTTGTQNVIWTSSSIVSSFDLKNLDGNYVIGEGMGGGFIKDGKLYVSHNTPDGQTCKVYVVDLVNQKMLNELDMRASDFEETLTGVGNYCDQLVGATKGNLLYKFIFN